MKSIYIFCFFILVSSVTYAEDTFTESQLFANFKNENSCWYGIEDEMTKESEKIIDFLKKFSTQLKSNTSDFWSAPTESTDIPNWSIKCCLAKLTLSPVVS